MFLLFHGKILICIEIQVKCSTFSPLCIAISAQFGFSKIKGVRFASCLLEKWLQVLA